MFVSFFVVKINWLACSIQLRYLNLLTLPNFYRDILIFLGITSKLEHLKDAGITGTWLSPIFASPNVDQGYDISDYKNIDAGYGTMTDFENLVKRAKKLGIRIILDFVPNHTSDKHEWFLKSESKEPGFENYYIWVDKPTNGKQINNWVSINMENYICSLIKNVPRKSFLHVIWSIYDEIRLTISRFEKQSLELFLASFIPRRRCFGPT